MAREGVAVAALISASPTNSLAVSARDIPREDLSSSLLIMRISLLLIE
jgi:hypothetical protein